VRLIPGLSKKLPEDEEEPLLECSRCGKMCHPEMGGNFGSGDEIFNFCGPCIENLERMYRQTDPEDFRDYGLERFWDLLNEAEDEISYEEIPAEETGEGRRESDELRFFRSWLKSGKLGMKH